MNEELTPQKALEILDIITSQVKLNREENALVIASLKLLGELVNGNK